MLYFAIRAFVVFSMLLNGLMALVLIGFMALGWRTITILDLLIAAALLFGFLNAAGDLVEADEPAPHANQHPSDVVEPPVPLQPNPTLHIIRQRVPTMIAWDDDEDGGLDAFSSER